MTGELGLTGVVPSTPSKASGRTYSRRKFVSSKAQPRQTVPRSPIKTQQKKPVARKHGDIAQLQEALQEDIQMMATVQQELRDDKAREAEKCRSQIDRLRRAWDELKLDVERKTFKEQELKRTCQVFEAQIAAHEQGAALAAHQLEDLDKQYEEVQKQLVDVQTTKRIFQHMIQRLLSELDQARQEVALMAKRDKDIDKELLQVETSLRNAQNELRADQATFANILQDSAQRKHLRESQFRMLLELFDNEHPTSPAKDAGRKEQHSKSSGHTVQKPKDSIYDDITIQFLQQIAPKGYFGPERVKVQTPFSAGRATRSTEPEPVDEMQTVHQLIKLMGPLSVEEFVQRVNNHSARRDKLLALEREMRQRIEEEQNKRKELEDGLDRMTDKREEVVGKQIYHNAQGKQSAVSNAKARLEDVRQKAHHMEMTFEGMKQTIARLLTKVTSSAQPTPTNEQLADMIHKLGEDLTRLIKQIASALMKGTQHSMESNSIERPNFNKLPGYRKVSKVLFNKMIEASMDVSPRNLRIARPEYLDEDIAVLEAQESEEVLLQPVPPHERVFDRETLKRITQLIVNRETHSAKGRKQNDQG